MAATASEGKPVRYRLLSVFLLLFLAVSSAQAAEGDANCSQAMLRVDLEFELPPVAATFELPASAWDLRINANLLVLPATQFALRRYEGSGHPHPNTGDLIALLKGDATFRQALDYSDREAEGENWGLLKAIFALDEGSALLKVAFGKLDFLRDYFNAHRLCMIRMAEILESDPRIAQLEQLQFQQGRDTLMMTLIRNIHLPVYQVINSYLHHVRTQAVSQERAVLPAGIRSRRSDYPRSRHSFLNNGIGVEIAAPGRPLAVGMTNEKDLQLLGRIAHFFVDGEGNRGFGTIVARRQGQKSVEIDILDEVSQRLHTLHCNDRGIFIVEPR
jgi:hypothetical protein